MPLRSVEHPQEHVRTALHLLGELEDQLRVLGLIMPEHYYLFRLLAGAQRQLWLALAARESRGDRLRWWARPRRIAPKRGWAVMTLLEVVRWCALVVGFGLSCVSRYMWSALHVLWRN